MKIGDPYGIRTRVTAVKGRCLNRLTKGPNGSEGRTRTYDHRINSAVLYQLSYFGIMFYVSVDFFYYKDLQ